MPGKSFLIIVLLFYTMPVSLQAQRIFAGRVVDADGLPVTNANVYLSFTYEGNPHSFFDAVDEPDRFDYNPVRSNTILAAVHPESTIFNFRILDRKNRTVRIFADNDAMRMGSTKYYFDRLSPDDLLLKDDVYLFINNSKSLESTWNNSFTAKYLLLSGLSPEVLLHGKYSVEPWAVTDHTGYFHILIEDLPIDIGIYLVNQYENNRFVNISNVIGYAVEKDGMLSSGSVSVPDSGNTVEIVFDRVTSVNHDEVDAERPYTHELSANYPNPFNSATTITYFLSKRTKCELAIYDLRGGTVRTLISGEQFAGFHILHWDGTNDAGLPVASGIYLYRLETPDFVQTKKMALVR